MAELFRPNAEDEESPDEDKESKRLDPKKLGKLPILPLPPQERPATAEEVKRTVEFMPSLLEDPRADVLPKLEDLESDDEEEEDAKSADAFEKKAEEVINATAENEVSGWDEDIVHVHDPQHQENPAAEFQAPESEDEPDEPSNPATPSGGGGGGAPPQPPTPPGASSSPNQQPQPPNSQSSPPPTQPQFSAPNYQPNAPQPSYYNTAPPAPQPSVERQVKRSMEEERQRNLRMVVVAGVVTGLLLRSYLNGKTEGIKSMLIDPLTEKVTEMAAEHFLTSLKAEKASNQSETALRQTKHVEQSLPQAVSEALPAVLEAQEKVFDMEGNEITLQPGWHVERAAGGYSVVLDQHNRVVHDAIQYGEAFKKDQRREQVNPDAFAQAGGVSTAQSSSDDDPFAGLFSSMNSSSGGQQSDQSDASQPVDLDHRLPAPHKKVTSVVASPWLWIAIALIIIVYFVAALA
jgi:hypothetical protein